MGRRLFELPGPWVEAAVCAQTDPEEFFPEKGERTAAAKKVCFSCPVRVQCLEYAMAAETAESDRFGIWGGLTARERRQLARESGRERAA